MKSKTSIWFIDLLKKRNFLPIFLTQFFGAFNDNAFKLAMLTLLSYHLSQSEAQSEQYQSIASALFMLPFFIFSATAGQMADRFDKAILVRIIKWFEVILMSFGSFALYAGNVSMLLITLTGLGVHSTFFGPIKYAILPQHLPKSMLLGATALVESSTYLAILFGTFLGAWTIAGTGQGVFAAVFLLFLNAIAGLIASYFIPRAPSRALNMRVDWQIWRATFKLVKQLAWYQPKNSLYATQHNQAVITIYAISWFWWIGTIILIKLPDYTHYVLHAQSNVFAIFLALFSIGIACGSLIIKVFLAEVTTLRYVPICMFFLSVFACDLYLATPNQVAQTGLQSPGEFFSHFVSLRIAFDLFMLSLCSGLFIVPLYTYLQIKSHDDFRSRTIAVNNIINSIFMVLASLFVMVLIYWNISISGVFLILGVMNAGVAVLLWMLVRSLRGISEPITHR